MPYVYDDIYEICKNRRYLIDWLQRFGLLGDVVGVCSVCVEGSVRLVEDKSYRNDGVVWRCSNRQCNKKTSVREGSWYSGTHFLIEQSVKLTYYCVYELPGKFISRELKISRDHTVVDWRNFAREVCILYSVLEQDSKQIKGFREISRN